MSKAQEWGGMYQRYENKNLNNIQRFNERVSQDKESLEMHIVVFKTNSLHSSREFWAVSM